MAFYICRPTFSTCPPAARMARNDNAHIRALVKTCNPHSSFLIPHSSILNPQSSILNPHSSFLIPQSSILNPQSSILNPQSSFLHLKPLRQISQTQIFLLGHFCFCCFRFVFIPQKMQGAMN